MIVKHHKTTKIVLSSLLIMHLLLSIASAAQSKYIEIIVNNISRQQLIELTQHGLIIDHVKQESVTVYIPPEQISILDNMGLNYRILSQNRLKINTDGYPSIDQLKQTLQSFESNYPELCQLFEIGKSYEGRPLYFLKISDHVDIEEDEPEVKYISSMHGDEPVGLILCLNLIDDLLTQYNQDTFITELIDNLEIWIMPLMNPDGYVHHQRFNMQDIDLNRNFPDRVNDNNNTTAGRAVEVQHVMNWEFAHSSVLSVNFHGGTAVVNYPYDSDFNPYARYSATPDDKLFREMALSYANLNPTMRNSSSFESGITNGVEWYLVYGGMQDWSYVWMGCMEVTIELDNEKWPVYSKLSQLWDNNREAMFNYFTWALKGIRGIITDSITGEPIHASIQVEKNDFRVYTDPDVGDYHRILLPGVYNLIVSADGYVTQYLTDVQISDGYASRHDIALRPDLNISVSDIINMIQVLSLSKPVPIQYYDINRDGQLELTDVIWAMHYLVSNL